MAIFALEFAVTKTETLATKNLRSMRSNKLDFHNFFCPRMHRQRKSAYLRKDANQVGVLRMLYPFNQADEYQEGSKEERGREKETSGNEEQEEEEDSRKHALGEPHLLGDSRY
ncbi:uncharacterized protein A4U43_C10F17810 [Asparagus officinalis]|uniref:Uncharacterized protein n=1 Tax=Asparagus officinalis TaxID=4686 RepID=A0A5P1E6V8_ASPOF|nr:uncharacterized protein A4U43_C10F17810 [Asparagus officinalis]